MGFTFAMRFARGKTPLSCNTSMWTVHQDRWGQLFALLFPLLGFLAKTKMSTDGAKRQRWKNEDNVEVKKLLPTSQVLITFARQLVPANRKAALYIHLMQLIAHVNYWFRMLHFALRTLEAPRDSK